MLLPYTHIWTELLKLGVSWADGLRMPWGVCRMMFEARADAWNASKHQRADDDVRYATKDDVDNWV